MKIKTSEQVGKGHPDKIADQISDAILDECLKQDPNSRVACEVMITGRNVIIGGEITTEAIISYIKISHNLLKKLNYKLNDLEWSDKYFYWFCKDENNEIWTFYNKVSTQSNEISKLVSIIEEKTIVIGHTGIHNIFGKTIEELWAGDQGIMFGYATNETPELMPLPWVIATRLNEWMNKTFTDCNLDSKSQVSFDGDTLVKVVLAVQTKKSKKEIFNLLWDEIFRLQKIYKFRRLNSIDDGVNVVINTFEIGGPIGDTGLTGRKIIADSYGGFAHHGGGAFSGKDYTKVDRTGAIWLRYLACQIVKNGWAKEIELHSSWTIGETKPLSIEIVKIDGMSFDIWKESQEEEHIDWLLDFLKENNKSLSEIIEILKLKEPKYLSKSVYGHFGREDY